MRVCCFMEAPLCHVRNPECPGSWVKNFSHVPGVGACCRTQGTNPDLSALQWAKESQAATPSTGSPHPSPLSHSWFPPWFWSGTAASQPPKFHELQRQLLLSTDHPGHQVKFKLNVMHWCCWQDVYMIRAGETAFLLIRYIAMFRDRNSLQKFSSNSVI